MPPQQCYNYFMTKRYYDLDKLSSSFLERQTIRLLCFALAGMSIAWSLQLLITFFLTKYESWVQQNVNQNGFALLLIITPLILGSILWVGKVKKQQSLITFPLFLICLYNIFMGLFNAVLFLFQGAPMLLHFSLGIFALILYIYYSKRDDVKQDEELIL